MRDRPANPAATAKAAEEVGMEKEPEAEGGLLRPIDGGAGGKVCAVAVARGMSGGERTVAEVFAACGRSMLLSDGEEEKRGRASPACARSRLHFSESLFREATGSARS